MARWQQVSRPGVPHGRGDEPQMVSYLQAGKSAFPTGVGMNRTLMLVAIMPLLRSPRAWG